MNILPATPITERIMLVVLTCLLALAISGCKSSQQKTEEEPPQEEPKVTAMTEVASGQYSGMEEMDNYLINDINKWKSVWKKIHATQSPRPSLPAVNFEEKTLVACFMGGQRSGGFRIEIKSMTCKGKNFDAKLIHHEPGRNCLMTMALTQPYVVMAIDKCEAINENFDIDGKVQDCK